MLGEGLSVDLLHLGDDIFNRFGHQGSTRGGSPLQYVAFRRRSISAAGRETITSRFCEARDGSTD